MGVNKGVIIGVSVSEPPPPPQCRPVHPRVRAWSCEHGCTGLVYRQCVTTPISTACPENCTQTCACCCITHSRTSLVPGQKALQPLRYCAQLLMKRERRGFGEDENTREPGRKNYWARLGLLSRRRLDCGTTESVTGRRVLLKLGSSRR